jgi:hypothetical protein
VGATDEARMTLTEHLLRRSQVYWDVGSPVPIDLFYEMLAAGLDVDALEKQHKESELVG